MRGTTLVIVSAPQDRSAICEATAVSEEDLGACVGWGDKLGNNSPSHQVQHGLTDEVVSACAKTLGP